MRTGVLFAQFADDAHLHVPQDAAHDAVAATAASRAPATSHPLRRQVLVFDIQRVSDTTTASQRRHQRATRLSALPTDVQLLLLAEKTLPGQARAVRHPIRVRILPTAISHQEQPDNAQEPATQGLGGGTKTSHENLRRRRCRSNLVHHCRNDDAAAAVRVSTVTVTTGRLQRLPVVIVVCPVTVTVAADSYRKHGIGEQHNNIIIIWSIAYITPLPSCHAASVILCM